MHKVLFVAYNFPPINNSGVYRSAKFVKYLPAVGWQPYVLATDRVPEEGLDETLLTDVPPDVPVWRVPTPCPRPVNRLAAWVGWKPATAPGREAVGGPNDNAAAPVRPLRATRLRRALLSPLYLVQDPLVDRALYWSLGIVPLARRIIREERIDVVLTTVPPWSALLTGALLQRLTGRPWVADFRDPWTDNKYIYFPSSTRRRFDERLERTLLARADAVVAVTEPLLQDLQAKVEGDGRARCFVVIPNGWDADDFPDGRQPLADGTARPETGGRVILLHPGSTYRGEPLPILDAVEQMPAQPEIVQRLKFQFVGYMHPADQARVTRSPHAALFELEPERIPHVDALRRMREAHVLLLFCTAPAASSGKIFEYMVSGRPVLTISTGVAADLVREAGIGCVVPPQDGDALARILKQIALDYAGFVAEYYRPRWDVIERFDRRRLARQLSEVLAQAATGSADPRRSPGANGRD
jgi:glycosyltransferase involved in cell wall biosynthesis